MTSAGHVAEILRAEHARAQDAQAGCRRRQTIAEAVTGRRQRDLPVDVFLFASVPAAISLAVVSFAVAMAICIAVSVSVAVSIALAVIGSCNGGRG